VKKAIGEYIVFLDADDLWYPNHLSQFIESISLFPNQKIFCNNYEIALGKGVTKETHFSILFDETPYLVTNFFRASLKNSIAWTSAICIERELFEDHKFDEEIRSGQDTDLWIVLGLKFPFVFHKNVSAIHRKWIVNSLSKTKNINSRKLILDKYSSFQYNDAHFEHYLNQLRFSLWLQAKCDEQLVIAQQLQSNLLVKYLSFKQKIVLRCSPKQLRQLLFIKKSIRYCVYYLTYVKKGMCL